MEQTICTQENVSVWRREMGYDGANDKIEHVGDILTPNETALYKHLQQHDGKGLISLPLVKELFEEGLIVNIEENHDLLYKNENLYSVYVRHRGQFSAIHVAVCRLSQIATGIRKLTGIGIDAESTSIQIGCDIEAMLSGGVKVSGTLVKSSECGTLFTLLDQGKYKRFSAEDVIVLEWKNNA